MLIIVIDRNAVVTDHASKHHPRAKRNDADYCRPETRVASQPRPYAPAVLPADISRMTMVVAGSTHHRLASLMAACRLAGLSSGRPTKWPSPSAATAAAAP